MKTVPTPTLVDPLKQTGPEGAEDGVGRVNVRKGRRTKGKPGKRASKAPKGNGDVSKRQAPVDKIMRAKVATLTPYAKNPRLHSPEQVQTIANSMREFGQTQLVVVDEKGEIICGHGRILAAELLGWTHVMVGVAVGWSETQRKAYRITDNQLTLAGEWSADLLGGELAELQTDGVDFGLLGFGADELASLGYGVDGIDLPELADGDRPPFQQMTFTVHDTQVPVINDALKKAKAAGAFDGPNENSNGNGLGRVCEAYLREGHSDRGNSSKGGKRAGKAAAL